MGKVGGGGSEFSSAEYHSSLQDIKERKDEDLLVLPTDAVLFDDPSFKVRCNDAKKEDG